MPARPAPRWHWPVAAVVSVLLAAAWTVRLRDEAHFGGPLIPAEPATPDELCKDLLDSGWKVKHPPDLPGPYTRLLPGFLYYHAGKGSTVRLREGSGAVVWEERTRPGVEFHTLVLETADGRQAHGLLVRGE